MVDFNNKNGNGSNSGAPGGKGDSAGGLNPTQHNKIVATMLNPRRRWRLTRAAKQAAMAATLGNLEDEDGRVVNGAVANLLRMESQNQSDQHKLIDKLVADKHEVRVREERLEAALAEVRSDETYGELQRQRLLGNSDKSGAHGGNGHAGQMGNGSAPRNGGP